VAKIIRGVGFVLPITTPTPRVGTSTTRRSSGCGATTACACATAPTQAPGRLNDTEPADRRRTERGVNGGLPVDATTYGRPIKIVSIVDEHTRECLGGLDKRNITGRHLIDELDHLAVNRGYPAVLRCDNGPELACAAIAEWAGERVGLHFIPPAQPWRNGYIESFSSRVRDEFLNINMFTGSDAGGDQRLEGRLQPPPATLRARLPGASGLRGRPHPSMIDSH
jgi:transposase InsO family protein